MSVDSVLVERLKAFIDPFRVVGRRGEYAEDDPDDVITREEFLGAEPRVTFEDNHYARDIFYDLGRVVYFRNLFRDGLRVDPIELDCRCDRGRVYPEPVLIDGHHRFAGAILAGAKRIRVSFSGRVDLLCYLQGRRVNAPLT